VTIAYLQEATMNDPESDGVSVERRVLLASVGLLAAGLAHRAAAQEAASSTSLPPSFKSGFATGPKGIIEARAPFDLANPRENWYALMKTTNNLVGARTYVPMFLRAFLCPQGTAGFPIYTSFGMWTWQLEAPDPAKFDDLRPGDVIQRAMYTGVICDPWTFQPVQSIRNPYTGKTVEVRDSLFAESWLLLSGGRGFRGVDRPGFRATDEERAKRGTPYVRFGEDTAFNIAGILQGEGPLQPRVDGSFWTVRHADLMDPRKDLIEATYCFAGISRARERKWLGLADDDPSQLLFNTQGRKVHSLDRIPQAVKDTVLRKYPDRI
jgi:hypothetical protein